jgi:photosystem II stability/assembly factor-like uncharacterized protein
VIHDDGDRGLARRIHRGLDPMLPASGVEQRVMAVAGERIRSTHRARPAWLLPFQTTLGSALVAVAVVALVGGALGLTLALRGHPMPAAPKLTPVVPVIAPTYPPSVTATPAPSPTSSTPGTIAYVQPESVSFPNASDGWVAGQPCDAQGRCETGIARTTDGGARWSLVATPVNPLGGYAIQVSAASSEDAWIWGTVPDGAPGTPEAPVFAATHDAGRTWQEVNLGGTTVVDVQVADGTAWAETACAPGAAPCTARLLSQPERGGAWTTIGPVPQAVQGPAFSNGAVSGPYLVRSGTRAWVIDGNEQKPALVSTSDGGRVWTQLPLPCAYGANMTLGASSANQVMLACANEGGWPAPQSVWTSSDGGAHWTLRSRSWYTDFQPPEPNVGSLDNGGAPIGLAVIDGDTAWMVNDRGDDLVTHDAGVRWSPAALPVDYFGNAGGGEGVTFADQLHGWTFATAGLWVTTDGGAVWKRQSIIGPVLGY